MNSPSEATQIPYRRDLSLAPALARDPAIKPAPYHQSVLHWPYHQPRLSYPHQSHLFLQLLFLNLYQVRCLLHRRNHKQYVHYINKYQSFNNPDFHNLHQISCNSCWNASVSSPPPIPINHLLTFLTCLSIPSKLQVQPSY